jgi:dTDP-4-dehydrorhamnose reductase
MHILITGAEGQLGRALARFAVGHTVTGMDLDVDIRELACRDHIAAARPDLVINAAAITDVDGCETDPDEAYAVNAIGARNVALGAALVGAALVQVSTDYVFDGQKGEAYWEFDAPAPVNVYGASKLAGEDLVRAVHGRVYVVRTAWLYGVGSRNFATRILHMAASRTELSVVDNEFGSPTFCDDLAEGILQLVATGAFGTYHLVNEGTCSRHEFARAVLDGAGRPDFALPPIDHFPRQARPPAYAPLRNYAAARLGVSLPHWREGLRRFFERGGGRVD